MQADSIRRGGKEYHENNSEIIIDNTEINHTVQIFGCKSSVIQIKGKVNAVNMGGSNSNRR
jgi:adenylyl cyclase-associated protein